MWLRQPGPGEAPTRVTIKKIHYEEEPPYYTVEMEGGGERQTERSRLSAVASDTLAPRPADAPALQPPAARGGAQPAAQPAAGMAGKVPTSHTNESFAAAWAAQAAKDCPNPVMGEGGLGVPAAGFEKGGYFDEGDSDAELCLDGGPDEEDAGAAGWD